MLENDTLKAKGKLHIVVRDSNGKIKNEINVNNLVVTTGKNYIVNRMKDNTVNVMSHMAVGTSNATVTLSQELLTNELVRVTATPTVTTSAITYVANFGTGVGQGELQEAGIFNSASGGIMLCRTAFAPINKGANDTMSISWQITIS